MLALGVIGIFLFVGGMVFTLTHKQRTPIPPRTLAEIAKAEQGDVATQNRLARCYRDGEGVTKDAVEAVKWSRRAAEQNDINGQLALSAAYQLGQGVAQDYVEAYAWANLNSNKESLARSFMSVLAPRMSPQQLADAEKRTKELQKEIEAKTKSKGH